MDEIDILQSDVMNALAHPIRLRILHRLAVAPMSVSHLAADLGVSQPNTSQHLAVMRNAGVVEAVRAGREVAYRLTDPDVTVACALMRSVLERRIARLAALSSVTRAGIPATHQQIDTR